jgi:hypothetical protein
MQLDQIVPEDFETLQGKTIVLEQPAGSLALEVMEVRRLPRHSIRATAPFAVILRGPRTPALAQGTHSLEHPAHGTLAVFMVPIGPDGIGFSYEITFN